MGSRRYYGNRNVSKRLIADILIAIKSVSCEPKILPFLTPFYFHFSGSTYCKKRAMVGER